jgi:hypothetical protein
MVAVEAAPVWSWPPALVGSLNQVLLSEFSFQSMYLCAVPFQLTLLSVGLGRWPGNPFTVAVEDETRVVLTASFSWTSQLSLIFCVSTFSCRSVQPPALTLCSP